MMVALVTAVQAVGSLPPQKGGIKKKEEERKIVSK
jgi:hypothetical protein